MSGLFEKTSNPKRVFIVDDHPIVRKGLAAQIGEEPDLLLCGEADDVAAAAQLIAQASPDLVIVDISLKNSNGIDLVKRLKDSFARLSMLVWSMYPELLYAERALSAGANGYLNKGCSTEQLVQAIRTVLNGKIYVSAEMSKKLLSRFAGQHNGPTASYVGKLTQRELQAFEYIGQGLTTRQTASKLHVSPKTIDTYRARIKEKLGLTNSTELVQHAVRWTMGKEIGEVRAQDFEKSVNQCAAINQAIA